jgi:diguanylate cyclase
LQPVPRPSRPVAPTAPRINSAPIDTAPMNSSPTNSSAINSEALDTALFAWEWARVLVGTSWVVDDRTEIAERLRGLTLELVQALELEPFVPTAGISIGESLVKAGFASPDALARTTTLITQRLLPDLRPTGQPDQEPVLDHRLAELVGMICLGFVRAVRDRTLEEQEAIRGSAMLAWERARADQRAYALRDPLTGLFSRDGFIARLGELIERSPAGVVGACLLTVDGFDALDHGLGRGAGDRLLATVGKRLAARFGADGELVARVGRYEFIVAAIDDADARRPRDTAAERLAAAQRAVREPISLDRRSIVLSTSSGLIARPTERTDPDGFLRDVDLAATWARSRGPGGVAVFDGARAAREVSDLALTADLPEAIDGGRLRPHYQPIVVLGSGQIVAVEALARWSHPRLGLLSPDQFIPLAERGGLISTLGRAILQQSCIQGQIWRTSLVRPPVVAVNLSAVQLADRQTVRDVVTVLEQTGLPPALLQLEITEHAALDEAGTLRIIRDLADVGVGLALDDFGTGRAHLAHLPELPAHGVHTLKVPADFLHRPPAGSGEAAADSARVQVFASIIDLAHRLGMQVTAEGIETPAHDGLVRELGADLAQGSYYCPPHDAVAIGRMLASGQRRPK